jgi:hypothetical protein
VNRLFEYADKLSVGHDRHFNMVFICGREPKISRQQLEGLQARPDFEIRCWNDLFRKTRSVYEHYRAVLEGAVDNPAFAAKEEEVARTRQLLEHGIHRDPKERAKGLPASDVDYTRTKKPKP